MDALANKYLRPVAWVFVGAVLLFIVVLLLNHWWASDRMVSARPERSEATQPAPTAEEGPTPPSIASDPKPADCTLRVVVKWKTSNHPIKGAKVEVIAGRIKESGVTDDQGVAQFKGLPVGGCKVVALATSQRRSARWSSPVVYGRVVRIASLFFSPA